MASILKVDKLDPQSGTALEVGTSGDTITVPSGVGLTLTDSTLLLPTTVTATTEVKTNKISPATGVAFTLGDSGDTFTVPSGATITNNGTATGFGGGKIGQVLQTVKTDTSSYGTEAWADITGMSVDITPSATSSKILVMSDAFLSPNTGLGLHLRLMRDTTAIYIGDAASSRQQATKGAVYYHAASGFSYAFQYLDSPNTTSATTYKLQWWPEINDAYIGRTYSDGDADYNSRTANSITVMEVLA